MTTPTTLDYEPIKRLTRDLKQAAQTLQPNEARYLVDSYYTIQEYRKATANQVRALGESAEPHSVIAWLQDQTESLENQIKRALDAWTDANPVGQWAKSITGIGPVISAGLLANIDIEKAPTVGHIWRFAGLDPTQKWLGRVAAKAYCTELRDAGTELDAAVTAVSQRVGMRSDSVIRLATTSKKVAEGEEAKPQKLTWDSLAAASARCPYNAGLKVLCWKIGESFVKVCNHEQDVYGKVYVSRKEEESRRNEAGELKHEAERALSQKKYSKSTEAYKAYSVGKLPPAHIHARAKRYAVKLFLSHYHDVAYRHRYGVAPPLPYPIAHLNHAHKIEVPQ